MANISHKDVPNELATRLKLAAIHARKSVREYTLDALAAAVGRDLDTRTEPGPEVSARSIAAELGHPYAVPHALPDPNQKKTVARAAAPVVPASSLPIPHHDPSACRLRGCGMCAAVGISRK